MKLIILVACVKRKLDHPAMVRDMYDSDWFRSAMKYAERLSPDLICVLSAKYGLLSMNDEITPYEQTLKTMKASEIKVWATQVLVKLASVSDLKLDNYVLIAGENYRSLLIPHLAHYQVPMLGLKFGQQLQFLKTHL